jgi:hypothetical protein
VTPSIPLLVISCDRYADVWQPFFTIFFRQWPACPFAVHLGTNHATYPDPRVRMIHVGDDRSWASGVRSMLDALGTEHVLIFLEDFLIEEPVDDAMVRRLAAIAVAEKERVASVRLSPLPPPSRVPEAPLPQYPELGIVAPRTPYRVSAQPAIWRTDVLRRLLVPGFSAWQFEEIGTQMSEQMREEFWGPFRPSVIYDHGIEKGKWKPEGLRICRELGVPVDLAARPAFTDEELRAHMQAGERPSAIAALKASAIDSFRERRRSDGLRSIARYLRAGGSGREAFAIGALGLLGPRAVRLGERWNVRRKVRSVRRRFEREEAPGPK